jgi:phosphatidate cytidylyltransferase
MPVWMMIDLGIELVIYTSDRDPSYELLYSPVLPCTVIFSIWINDTMAYIVGSLIGKTPFSKISAKKTWEGTIGGALLCVIVISSLGSIFYGDEISTKHWILMSALAAVFGTLGDLFESKLKRMADLKDSGSIMPGHGGFLDRFDSMLFAAPAVWFYAKAFL